MITNDELQGLLDELDHWSDRLCIEPPGHPNVRLTADSIESAMQRLFEAIKHVVEVDGKMVHIKLENGREFNVRSIARKGRYRFLTSTQPGLTEDFPDGYFIYAGQVHIVDI